ncbi:MAG: hypothetical protein SGARI_002128 [Bacillariaceae sp.]
MADFQHVYEPSDDTYLLLDGILCDDELVSKASSDDNNSDGPCIILEIGTGSGVPINYLTKHLRDTCNQKCVAIATDINPDALQFAKKTAHENGVHLQLIQCDLPSPLLERLEGKVDMLLFNPRYVPTPNEEVAGNSIEASWAGGDKGRLVIDRALPQIARLLRRKKRSSTSSEFVARCYMITVDDNDPEEIATILKAQQQHSMKMEPWVRRRAHNEYLTVQKITPIIIETETEG